MAEKAAEQQSTEDQLFAGVDFAGLEDSLITVDTPDLEDDIKNEVEEVSEGGSGEPPAGGDDPPKLKTEQKTAPKEDDLITVDVPPEPEKKEESAKAEKKEDTKSGEKANKDEENLSPMYLHAAALQESGLLPDFDLNEIKDLEPKDQALKVNEHIQKVIEDERKSAIDNALSEVEQIKQMYDDIQNGVNAEDLKENLSLEAQYGNIKMKDIEDNIEAQESLYTNYLLMKGLSETKAKQLVDLAKDNETLLTEAADGLKDIQDYIKEEREELRRQAEERKKVSEKTKEETKKKVNEVVTSTKEIIPGIELTKMEHDQIIKDMTVPVRFDKRSDGTEYPVSRVMDLRSKDPIRFEMLLNYYVSRGFFDDKPKFDNLIKKAEKTAAQKFVDRISDQTKIKGDPRIVADQNEKPEFIFPKEIIP